MFPRFCIDYTSTRNNQLNSPLLRLPAEIRNLVYIYTFTNSVIWAPPRRGYQSATNPIGLIHCCRLLHHEANALFFPTATFALGSVGCLFNYKDITTAIGVGLCAQITSVEIHITQAELQSQHSMHPMSKIHVRVKRQAKDNSEAPPALERVYVRGSKLWSSEKSPKTRASLVRGLCFAFGKPDLEVVFEVELERMLAGACDGKA